MCNPQGAVIAALLVVSALVADANEPLSKEQRFAESLRITNWAWSAKQANMLYSLGRASSPFDIVTIRPHDKPGIYHFKIMDGEREVYAWWGHTNSVFVVKDDRLFYVDFAISMPGGKVVAVDLKAGKELWKSQLRAVELRGGHSIYSNSLNIDSSGDFVSVFGNEGAGRYFEVKDAKTGQTVGHKVFPVEEHPASDERDGASVGNQNGTGK